MPCSAASNSIVSKYLHEVNWSSASAFLMTPFSTRARTHKNMAGALYTHACASKHRHGYIFCVPLSPFRNFTEVQNLNSWVVLLSFQLHSATSTAACCFQSRYRSLVKYSSIVDRPRGIRTASIMAAACSTSPVCSSLRETCVRSKILWRIFKDSQKLLIYLFRLPARSACTEEKYNIRTIAAQIVSNSMHGLLNDLRLPAVQSVATKADTVGSFTDRLAHAQQSSATAGPSSKDDWTYDQRIAFVNFPVLA